MDVFALPHSPRVRAPRQLAQLTAPDGQANDALGISVAISGATAVAGADLHRVAGAEQGVAYVFTNPPAAGTTPARPS